MEGTPVGILIDEFEEELKLVEGVVDVHDLHVWALSAGKPAMSAHIFSNNTKATLKRATELCRKYGIFHSTLQIEDWSEREGASYIKCDHNIH